MSIIFHTDKCVHLQTIEPAYHKFDAFNFGLDFFAAILICNERIDTVCRFELRLFSFHYENYKYEDNKPLCLSDSSNEEISTSVFKSLSNNPWTINFWTIERRTFGKNAWPPQMAIIPSVTKWLRKYEDVSSDNPLSF